MKILIIGAVGQLGTDLVKALSTHDLVVPDRKTLDVVQLDQIHQILKSERPQVVINTAAFHQVDQCESEVSTSFQVNSKAIRDLALVAREIEAVLVHFSTDYVFDGQKTEPYSEEDQAHPINVYGVSKLAGEQLVESVWEKSFLIRTCGLYGHAGSRGKGSNFVETMVKKAQQGEAIRVVDDQRLTPTSTEELARKTADLIETSHYGIYHITSHGDCTWYEFAREIFSVLAVKVDLAAIASDHFFSLARRPRYSVLANDRLEKLGMDDLKDWEEALRDYLGSRMT